jgi:cytochrome c553
MTQSGTNSWILALVLLAGGASAPAGELSGSEAGGTQAMIGNVCEACHGKYGNSTNPSVPSLAGQGSAYLEKQLAAFQAQRRVGVMSGIAMTLNTTEIRDAARYFSAQIPRSNPLQADDSTPGRGAAIYDEGVAATQVPACASCHALNGAGLPPEFPRLAGQHSRYVADQLRAFRSDSRLGANAMMHEVSVRLTDREITAVADYIAGLR